MLTKTITFKDFNGNERTEDFRFNLNKLEMLDLSFALGSDDGESFKQKIENYLSSKDYKPVIDMIQSLVLKAYGVKSEDGLRFEKSKELSTAFSQHPAYEEMIYEMMQNPEAASEFMIALIPSDYREEVKQTINESISSSQELIK